MAAGEAVRWRRYGKDRLYVTSADGTKLGYRDLLTGVDHVAELPRRSEFVDIVGRWSSAAPDVIVRGSAPLAARAEVPPAVREQRAGAIAVHAERPAVDEPDFGPGEDLAQRRPGAVAREQALALKEAAPVRTFLARILGVHSDERAWRIGADGEEKVAAQLMKLARKDPRWRNLHAIPVGENGSDIDHLVVGPGGVYSLNAKHHPGANVWVGGDTLMINGQRQPYIRNSRYEAQRATRLLTVACGFPVLVTGLVVPVGADVITMKTPPAEVHVLNRMRLIRWLRDRPSELTNERIEAVFSAARRSTTWVPAR